MSFFYHQAGKKYASLRLDMLYPSRYPPKNPTCQQLMFFFFRFLGAVRYWLLRIHNLRIANDTLLKNEKEGHDGHPKGN